MSASRPSVLSAAGANSHPPVTFGKPEASRPVAPSYACRSPSPVPATTWEAGLPGSTLAMVELERNWKSSVIRGYAGAGAPLAASQAPIRWL